MSDNVVVLPRSRRIWISPVAAYATLDEGVLRLTAISFRNEVVRRGELNATFSAADALGPD
jgi:hypothetical protein